MVRPVDPNEVGDLVPMFSDEHWPSRDMGPTYQEQLKELAHKTAAVRSRWKCDLLPMDDSPLKVAFKRTAHICAVQLSGGNVGVLRMDPETGDCHLFLRLKRTDWFAWADRSPLVSRTDGRVFSKRVDDALGKKMLMDARGFTLGLWDVHHPHALSLLCTMSKHGWLDYAKGFVRSRADDDPQMGAFTLVALPPLPAEFEQCLGLLGHSAAFVNDADDDIDVPLSGDWNAKPIPKVWGTNLAGDLVKGPLAHHFEQGAREVGKHAAPFLFALHIPDFNKFAPVQKNILDGLRCATNTVPLRPEPASESPQPYLYPSDNEEELAAAVAAAATEAVPMVEEEPSPPPSPSPPPPPPPRQRTNPPAARRPKRGRAKASDSDDLSDSDEDDTSENETSEEEDSSSGSDDSSSSSYSGSSSSSSSGSGTESQSGSPDVPPPPASKRARSKAPATAVVAPAPDLNSDQGLLTVLAEMAKPCCERLKKLKRSHGVGLTARHHNQVIDDLKLLEEAASPVALLAAALNIVTTLADIQADRFRGDAVLVRRAEAQRLCALAAQTGEFAEAVRTLLDGATCAGED